MSLWVDKYKPLSLNELDYHKDQAENLRKLVSNDNFPHLLIYGPSGAGKKTRIHCILRELYGTGVEKLRLTHQEFETPSNKKIDISLVVSNHHIEVNPSDVGIHDRVVIQDLIKNAASTQYPAGQQKNFKVIIMHEADKLTADAQHALRRTMEKYISSCRLILCAESTSKIIPAIRSRCLPIRVAAPSKEEVERIVVSVCKKESLQIPRPLAKRIADDAGGNLRRALLAAETCKAQQYPFTDNQVIEPPEWLSYIKETASKIIGEQSPKRLLEVRNRLYELLGHCIPADVIMKTLADELAMSCDAPLKIELYQLAAHYEYRMRLGQKPIFHLEAFVAKFMSIYKNFFDNELMDDNWE